jgi:hypothetical protein
MSVLMSTTDADLQRQLGEEVANIRSYTEVVSDETFARPDRQVGWGVRLAAWAIKDKL